MKQYNTLKHIIAGATALSLACEEPQRVTKAYNPDIDTVIKQAGYPIHDGQIKFPSGELVNGGEISLGYSMRYSSFRDYLYPLASTLEGNIAYIPLPVGGCKKKPTGPYQFPSQQNLQRVLRLADKNGDFRITRQEARTLDNTFCVRQRHQERKK